VYAASVSATLASAASVRGVERGAGGAGATCNVVDGVVVVGSVGGASVFVVGGGVVGGGLVVVSGSGVGRASSPEVVGGGC
jgi:hypothetical protein